MTRRILHINCREGEDLSRFQKRLENEFRTLGLRDYGRVGHWEVAGPRFPSTYVVESSGEGGFVVEYGRTEVRLSDSGDTKFVDASLIPVGTTGSLVQRVYSELKQRENCTEVEF
jgi:hypothetical protein